MKKFSDVQIISNQNISAKQSSEKSWQFDVTSSEYAEGMKAEKFILPASKKDFIKVRDHYLQNSIAGKDIKSIQIIYNKQLRKGFKVQLSLLNARHNNDDFKPQWKDEPEWRNKVTKMAEELTKPHADPDYPHVKLFLGWHGTKTFNTVEKIKETGFANLAKTDKGYFGKGLYFTESPEYAYQVYSNNGYLILTYVCFYLAHPTIRSDQNELAAKGNYGNCDVHFVPVIPPDGTPSKTTSVYYACEPNQPHQYFELVAFEKSQCLPFAVIELQPSLPKAPSLPAITSSNENIQKIEDAKAQYELGNKYVNDNNYKQAIICYQKAAHASPGARYNLGNCYYHGHGVKQDYEKAVFWYKKNVDYPLIPEDRGKAACALATCYYNGHGVPQDYKQAVDWYQKAATLQPRNVTAIYMLGVCHEYGLGIDQDLDQAASYYQRAVKLGDDEAKKSLERIRNQTQTEKKYSQNSNTLIASFSKTNTKLSIEETYQKGYYLYEKEHYQQALQYFKEAAEGGHVNAQYFVATCYYEGQDIKQDYNQAVYWYQKAANQGNEEAKEKLKQLFKIHPELQKFGNNPHITFSSQVAPRTTISNDNHVNTISQMAKNNLPASYGAFRK